MPDSATAEYPVEKQVYDRVSALILPIVTLGEMWKDDVSNRNGSVTITDSNLISQDYRTAHLDPHAIIVQDKVNGYQVSSLYKRITAEAASSAKITDQLNEIAQTQRGVDAWKKLHDRPDPDLPPATSDSLPPVSDSQKHLNALYDNLFKDTLREPDVITVKDNSGQLVAQIDYRRDIDRSPKLSFGGQTVKIMGQTPEQLAALQEKMDASEIGQWYRNYLPQKTD